MDPYGYQFARFAGETAARYVVKRGRQYFEGDADTMLRHRKAHRKMGPGFRDVRAGRDDPGAGYQQLTYAKKAHAGRKLSKRAVALRALQAQLLTKIDRYQGLTGLSTAAGFYPLSSYNDANNVYLPYYVFDLSCLESNVATTGGTIYKGIPMMRLQRVLLAGATANTWQWSVQTQDAGTGGGFNTWVVERQPYASNTANAPYEKCMLNWADIRLVMTGATKYPSGIDVQIVKFYDDERQPPVFYNDGAVQTLIGVPSQTDKSFAEYSRFWQSQVDNLSINPIGMREQPADTKGVKVLKSARFTFQPTMSTETDTIGHQKVFKMFYEMNKVHSYRNPTELAAGDLLPAANQLNPTFYVSESTVSTCHVVPQHRTARTYLVIKGHTAASSNTAGDFPSFDLMVRRKVTVI